MENKKVIDPLKSLSEEQQKAIIGKYKQVCEKLNNAEEGTSEAVKSERKQLEWLFGKNFFKNVFDNERLRLLFVDLAARIPYNTKVNIDGNGPFLLKIISLSSDSKDDFSKSFVDTSNNDWGIKNTLDYVKPYLFPLSSMTEGQRKIFKSKYEAILHASDSFNLSALHDFYDWVNKNHLDHHYLIPRGLAIDATGLNIY